MDKQGQSIDISVVVPVYNEEGNVQELHRRIIAACQKIGKSYEVIFVDDGSRDGTVAACAKLSPLTLVRLRKNFGQTAAFDAGFKAARGTVIITMDGDLQNDPSDIELLLAKMREGYDVVSGWRYERKDSLSKRIFSRTADKLRKILLHDSIHDSGCSLKAYNAQALKSIDLFGEMHRFIPALLELDGYRVGEVKVTHHPRVHGVTKYNWKRSVKGFVDMVSLWFWGRYASRPIHFFGAIGMSFMFLGTVILGWMAVEKILLHASIAERIWPLMGVFLVVLGVQFFVFGLLTDIMMKTYYISRKRMNYAVQSTVRQ